jgi:DNA-directed RNA polymerase subunit RPC12/RpoP
MLIKAIIIDIIKEKMTELTGMSCKRCSYRN